MRLMPLIILITSLAVSGCQKTYVINKPDFGDSDYANYHEEQCRKDIPDICVETDVALDSATIKSLVQIAETRQTGPYEVVAVRINEHLSSFNRLPTIEVVSGGYNWTDAGIQWDAHEFVSIFVWDGAAWQYQETDELMIDPV